MSKDEAGPADLWQITWQNVGQLRVLHKHVFPVSYQDPFYSDVVEKHKEHCRLAYYADILVGAICCRVEIEDGRPRLYVMTLGVLEPYRRMGIASQLIRDIVAKVEQEKEKSKISEIVLHMQTSNTPGLQFYERHGFENAKLVPNYYQKIDPPDAYLLRRTVTS
uniref:N-acetyltransferase domain-containing protein n=1 Tax=Oxyrrhis marina TaxID=2969 RepID=A0A7S4GLE3_OXYMA